MPGGAKLLVFALGLLAVLIFSPAALSRAAGSRRKPTARRAQKLGARFVPSVPAADGATQAPAATVPASPVGGADAGADRVKLVADPAAPSLGRGVRLVLADPPAGARAYRWYVDGRELPRSGQPPAAELSTVFTRAGAHTVAVRFRVGGQVHLRALVVRVSGPRRRSPHDDAPTPAGRAHASAMSGMQMGGGSAAVVALDRRASHAAAAARAAGDPVVTVSDFRFTPATITVHVGQTITWTNAGPMPHSATAHDGSFNTGVLQPGHSGSHTFTQAGTFSYFCSVHPFMHGTVVVLASSAASAPSSTTTPATPSPQTSTAPSPAAPAATSSSSQPSAPATAAAASARPTLPMTGMSVAACLAGGLGAAGRRRRVAPRFESFRAL